MPFLPREKQVKIGDTLYKIRELKASQRSIFLFRTNELLGESIASFVEGFIGNIDQIAAVGQILNKLSKNTSPVILNQFIKDTILTCVISPKAASEDTDEGYELHFCEYYAHITALLWAIYHQNFGAIVQTLKKKYDSYGNDTQQSSEKTAEAEGKWEKEKKNTVIPMSQKQTLRSTNFSNGQ